MPSPCPGICSAYLRPYDRSDHTSPCPPASAQSFCLVREPSGLARTRARCELNLREALAFLCQREIARKSLRPRKRGNERAIEMAVKIAHFPCVRDLEGFDFTA